MFRACLHIIVILGLFVLFGCGNQETKPTKDAGGPRPHKTNPTPPRGPGGGEMQ